MKTQQIFKFAEKQNLFYRTYKEDNTSGLVTLDSTGFYIREQIIRIWRNKFSNILDNVFEISSPILTPITVLKKSGHLDKFVDSNNTLIYADNLILRPETCQSIFYNFRRHKLKIKGHDFGILQVGLSYRNEKSSEVSLVRLKEFEQLEFEYFQKPKIHNYILKEKIYSEETTTYIDFIEIDDIGFKYITKLIELTKDLELDYRLVLLKDLPHYSYKTIDLEVIIQGQYREIASINYRSDCKNYTSENYEIFEISIGMHRLIWQLAQKLANNFKLPVKLQSMPILVNEIEQKDYLILYKFKEFSPYIKISENIEKELIMLKKFAITNFVVKENSKYYLISDTTKSLIVL